MASGVVIVVCEMIWRVLCLSMLCWLTLRPVGGLVGFSLARADARRAAKHAIMAGLPDSMRTTFRLIEADLYRDTLGFRWEHRGEFWYGADIYDVITMHRCGDTVLIEAFRDDAEGLAHLRFERSVDEACAARPSTASLWRILELLPIDPAPLPPMPTVTLHPTGVLVAWHRSDGPLASIPRTLDPPPPWRSGTVLG